MGQSARAATRGRPGGTAHPAPLRRWAEPEVRGPLRVPVSDLVDLH